MVEQIPSCRFLVSKYGTVVLLVSYSYTNLRIEIQKQKTLYIKTSVCTNGICHPFMLDNQRQKCDNSPVSLASKQIK